MFVSRLIMGIADKKTREDWVRNKRMKALNFYKDRELKEVNIIIESPVSSPRPKTALSVKCGAITLPVISIDNLITMKKTANRPMDKIDIEELKQIKKIGGRG